MRKQTVAEWTTLLTKYTNAKGEISKKRERERKLLIVSIG